MKGRSTRCSVINGRTSHGSDMTPTLVLTTLHTSPLIRRSNSHESYSRRVHVLLRRGEVVGRVRESRTGRVAVGDGAALTYHSVHAELPVVCADSEGEIERPQWWCVTVAAVGWD